MKKAQVSQIFVYIMSGLIITAVLGFGVKSLLSLMSTADDIKCLNFKQDLQKTVSKNKGYGSVIEWDPKIECEFREICFTTDVELHSSGKTDWPSGVSQDMPLVYDSWDSKVKQNVFFRNSIAEDFFYVEGLYVPSGIICGDIPYSNFVLKGKGDHVELISPP